MQGLMTAPQEICRCSPQPQVEQMRTALQINLLTAVTETLEPHTLDALSRLPALRHPTCRVSTGEDKAALCKLHQRTAGPA